MKKLKIAKNEFLKLFKSMLSFCLLLTLMSCGDDVEKFEEIDNGQIIVEESMTFPSGGGKQELAVETKGLELIDLDVTMSKNAENWASVTKGETGLTVTLEFNEGASRTTILSLSSKKGLRKDVTITQKAFEITGEYPENIFTDASCSALKEGVTDEDIIAISSAFYKKIAIGIKEGTYEDAEFRIQKYRPYQSQDKSAERTKTMHTWGWLDNITGIYADNTETELTILVGNTHGQVVNLMVKSYPASDEFSTYELKEGLNKIKPERVGLCYIMIQQDDYLPLFAVTDAEKKAMEIVEEKSVNIHFVTGVVNGYYSYDMHTAADSERLRENIKYDFFDVKGKYVHITWYSEDFIEAKTDFAQTVASFDKLIKLELEHAGFLKYGEGFSTRMHLRSTSSGTGNPNATKKEARFPRNYKDVFTNATEENMKSRIWGLAHEVGHATQTNPAMRWGGLGEVGNNMFSMHVTTSWFGFGQSNLLREGYYDKARVLIVDKKLPYADLDIVGSKHMERLVPLWQVNLYFKSQGYDDFYKDLYEHFRKTPDVGTTFKNSGPLQLDYVRQVCKIGKVNLIEFFEKWGFLTPVDITVKDYGDRIMKITQDDVDKLKAEIEALNLPKPSKDVTLIQDDNYESYK